MRPIILTNLEAHSPAPVVVRPVSDCVPDWIREFCVSCFTPNGCMSGYGIYRDEGPAYKHYKIPYPPGEYWVKEAWLTYPKPVTDRLLREGADTWPFINDVPFQYETEEDGQLIELGWVRRSPVGMPKWASRRELRIISVTCKPVREITEEEAANAGFRPFWDKENPTIIQFSEGQGELHLLAGPEEDAKRAWHKRYCKRYPWESAWAWIMKGEWA
jgi:hypothetical protein